MTLEITDSNIDEILGEKKVTLIDFHASWCGPCRMLGPVIDKLSEDNTNDGIIIGKIDSEDNKESVIKYSIRNLPTLLFFKDGELVDRLVGFQRLEVLKEKLENLINEANISSEE